MMDQVRTILGDSNVVGRGELRGRRLSFPAQSTQKARMSARVVSFDPFMRFLPA